MLAAKPSLKSSVASKLPAAAAPLDTEQVTQRRDGDTVEARSQSRTIRTVEDLLRHIEADMSVYEVSASEGTKWESASVDRNTGEPVVTELFRVWVRLRPRAGPSVKECVEAMIEAAAKRIRRPPVPKQKPPAGDGPWVVLVIGDIHYGKYCWRRTTGGDDYDLDIAERLVADASGQLLAAAARYKPSRITIGMVGDLFHYDTPSGTTTGGTPLERDGRIQKMIATGCDSLLAVVERAATVAPTDVTIVNGNHDEAMTWSFHRILMERFRGDRRVTIDGGYTGRKYASHGGTLLGFVHGHKAKKKLPQLMALEAATDWARCPYREFHSGHLHHQAAEWSRPIETIDGVLVRIAPALCPPDEYHAIGGWVASRQAMELFVYDHNGGLSAMHVAGPRIGAPT